ncbi:MAG: hypothetical protein B7X39_03385 [Lysobacterales bacterium 14-68-21]|nr:MAG: hypothetical protein B7X45_05015 [Xanthomonadales bacterium 15-68-25]OZB68225.1 MAG: hypothetical protein B7X39_03385 [Xanthomonadales bacterium 14-68-21]
MGSMFDKFLGNLFANRIFKFFEKIVINLGVWTIAYLCVRFYDSDLLARFVKSDIRYDDFADKKAFAVLVLSVSVLISLFGLLGRFCGVKKYADEYKDLIREDFSGFLVNFSSVFFVYYYLGQESMWLTLLPIAGYVIAYAISPKKSR